MSVLDWSGRGFDLSANAAATLADWAPALQSRGRFVAKGEGPDAFDCYGLALFVQRLIGRRAPSYAEFYAAADFGGGANGALDRLIRAEAESWRASKPGDVGDVLVCARGNAATHVAILCGAGHALHALETAGLVCTRIVGRVAVTGLLNMRIVGCVRPV